MSHFKTLRLALSPLALAVAAWTGQAHAGGFYLQEQSVRATGRAFSGESADQGAASLWWNPAAIGGISGIDGHFGISAIRPSGDVQDEGSLIIRPGQAPAPVGGDGTASDPVDDGYLPTGAIAWGITPKLAIGLAATAPYSFTTNYSADSWARYTADKTRVRTYDLQPSIAYMATDKLSIGAGLNIEYTDATLSNYLPNLSSALPDGHQSLDGDGWDLGWSLGAQYRAGALSLGAAYKSAIKHHLDGTLETTGLVSPIDSLNGTLSTSASFSTPWQASLGARYAANTALTLNAQVVRTGWSEFDTIDLGAPLDTAIPEHYRDTWSYAVGADYLVSPKWTVRAGIQRDQTPTRNGERDARVPDSNRWNFAGGASYALTPSFTLDGAVTYVHFEDASIDKTTAAYAGSSVQTPILVDGALKNAEAWVLSVGGRFSF